MEAGGDVGVRHGGMQEGVVDHFGDLRERDAEGFAGWRVGGCHCCLFERLRVFGGGDGDGGNSEGRREGGKGDGTVAW